MAPQTKKAAYETKWYVPTFNLDMNLIVVSLT